MGSMNPLKYLRGAEHLSPTDIIVRAAATVPENRDPDSEKNRAPRRSVQPPRPGPEVTDRPTGFAAADRATPHTPYGGRPNHGARRRWRARLPSRRFMRFATKSALAAGLVGALVWAWHSGSVDRVASWAGSLTVDMATKTSRDAGLVVQRVTLEGRRRTPLRTVRKALGIREGDAILLLDLDAAKRRLEALPWVRRATVARQLPDALTVRLVEHVAVARGRTGRGLTLIGADGTIIPVAVKSDFNHLPLVVGSGARQAAAALVALLAVEPTLARRVARARRIGRRRWDLTFDTGVLLRLPDAAQGRAWRKFAELERQHGLLQRGVHSLDMRLPDRLIIRAPGLRPAPKKRRNRRTQKE